jgi:nucleolar complex protein 2
MRKQPKPTTLKALDFSTSIRAGKAFLRTRVYQEGIGDQVAELLSEFFVLWTKSITFPELALPVVVMLKRWLKEVSNKNTGNKNGKVNFAIGLLVQKLESNSRWIESKRVKVDFAPNNRSGVEMFLKEESWEKTPLGAFVVGQRKTREEKAKVLEQGRKEHDRKKKRGDDDNEKEEGGAFGEDDDDSSAESVISHSD